MTDSITAPDKRVKLNLSKDEVEKRFAYADGGLVHKAIGPSDVKNPSRLNSRNCRVVGCVVGGPDGKGYLRTAIWGKCYAVHRLIWIMHNGDIPEGWEIDHINGIRDDNRIENLKAVPLGANHKNKARYKNNRSGVTGVSWCAKKNRWRAKVWLGGKCVRIGRFSDLKEAERAVTAFYAKNGFSKRHGKILAK